MTRLDWEKAKRQEKHRRRPKGKGSAKKSASLRYLAMAEFVKRHELSCFKCGAEHAEWAKTGTSARGPWVVCAGCVAKR